MAARENQGLHIALIIFVILTLLLTVTTFIFFRKYQEAQENITSLKADNNKQMATAKAANDDSEAIKAILGVPSTDKVEAIAATTKKDMEAHGKNLAEPNYRKLVELLATELKNTNTRITELTAHEKELADELKAKETANTTAIAEYTGTVDKTGKDLLAVRTQFDTDRKEITSKSATLAKDLEAKRRGFDDVVKTNGEKISALSKESEKLTKLLQLRTEQQDNEAQRSSVADGKINWVNQRSRIVWINIGSDDGLRRQTSFSVVSADDSNPAAAPRKGKIEVIRLMNRHLAEARIVEDDLSDPMMPGDLIYSPTWEPGRAEHFALAGHLDIDNDGLSDVKRIHDLIALNGGIVDAEVSEDGKKTGEMSINTKYLVLGDQPKIGGEGDRDTKTLDSYSAMRREAQTLGVKTINVTDFLHHMGYKAEDRTVNLGKQANPADFKPRFPDDVQRVAPGSRSMPRDLRKPRESADK